MYLLVEKIKGDSGDKGLNLEYNEILKVSSKEFVQKIKGVVQIGFYLNAFVTLLGTNAFHIMTGNYQY